MDIIKPNSPDALGQAEADANETFAAGKAQALATPVKSIKVGDDACKKVITIGSCEDCKFVWRYLGLDECCGLLNRLPIPLDDNNPIPAWCPLTDASQEIIEMETRLIAVYGTGKTQNKGK